MKIIYNPEAGYWQGVPARDLTQDEWQALPKELQKHLVEIGMYKVEKSKKEGE